MSFVNFQFFVFIPAVFIAYFTTPPKYRWGVLLVSSYVFYMFSDIVLTFFLVFTTACVFFCGLLLDKVHQKQKTLFNGKDSVWLKENKKIYTARFMSERRRILLVALLANFGILAFLKYYNFIAINIGGLLRSLSIGAPLPVFNLLLPLGISFYTFQSMGYLIDVYRGKYPADRHFLKFALFVSFFPQIIQGPISRYDQLAGQLYAPNRFDYARVKYGIQLMAWGYLKKLVIADRAIALVDMVLPNYARYSGYQVAIAVAVATLQIYADFSGGIDVTRGIAQVVGVDMAENFQRPYFASSIAEYWRRWHITLGAWMREYLFYPLSLSKAFGRLGKTSKKYLGNYFGKLFPTCLAMFIVFMTVGIWHGADWKYIAFGCYYGILIVGGILIEGPLLRFQSRHPSVRIETPIWRVLAVLKTCFLVFIGKYFSSAESFSHAIQLLKHTFFSFSVKGPDSGELMRTFTRQNALILFVTACLLFAVSFLQERGMDIRGTIARQHIAVRWIVYFIVLFWILLFTMNTMSKGFVYANF